MAPVENYQITLPNNVKFHFKYSKDLPNCICRGTQDKDCPSKMEAVITVPKDKLSRYVILQTFKEEVGCCIGVLIIDGPGRNHKCCDSLNDPNIPPNYWCVDGYSDNPKYACPKCGTITYYTIVTETDLSTCLDEPAAFNAKYTFLEGLRWGLEKTSEDSYKSLPLQKMTKAELEENLEVFKKTYRKATFNV